MAGRTDIEESKCHVAMSTLWPQASRPYGNSSGASDSEFWKSKGSTGCPFGDLPRAEKKNQARFWPFVQHDISTLIELVLGRLHCYSEDAPPQPHSLPGTVSCANCTDKKQFQSRIAQCKIKRASCCRTSEAEPRVVAFHVWRSSHLFWASQVISQCQIRFKLRRVFFPRWSFPCPLPWMRYLLMR